MVSIILRGLIIGILISAPMGPIGVLCIQRTLNKGRRPGFYTGVGAALSDLIYCLLTGLGLSFVTDFITSNQLVLQIIGSLLVLAYSIYLFQANPSKTLRPINDDSSSHTTYWRDFVTGFAFTFSNPLIIFLIISLFAQFNFMDSSMEFYHYIIGYASIAAGAILWWLLITFAVNKLRPHFNLRSMKIVNRSIAVLLTLMAIVGVVSGLYCIAQEHGFIAA